MLLNPNIRKILPQILTIFSVNVFLLVYGIALGYPVILIPALSKSNSTEEIKLSEEQISWIGSTNILSTAIANLFLTTAIRLFGYKKMMMFTNVLFMVYIIILRLSKAFWHIVFGLSIAGFAGGIMEAGISGYIMGISQAHLRGMFLATTALSKSVGVFITVVMGALLNWRDIALVAVLPTLISFSLLYFIQESPIWLLNSNRRLDAQKSLAWLRGWASLENVETELQELQDYLNIDQDANASTQRSQLQRWKETLKKFKRRRFLWPLSIIICIIFVQVYTGIVAVNVYATVIFATLNAPINKYYATIFLGIFEILGFLTGSFVVHRTGKRLLNITSLISTAICLTIVGLYCYLADIKYLTFNDVPQNTALETTNIWSEKTWIPLVFLVIYSFMNCCGMQGLLWILIGELFTSDMQTIGSVISLTFLNVTSFILVKITLKLISFLTLAGFFWCLASVSACGAITFYFILPETEGKTLQQISDHFLGIAKLDNKVGKKPKGKAEEESQNSRL